MRTVIDNIGKVLEDPKNISARSHLQWAATCAINGFASPGDAWTPIHQVAHNLTSLHQVPHGASLSILMPSWMEAFCSRKPEQYFRFATNVMLVNPEGKSKEAVIEEGIQAFRDFLKEISVPVSLKEAQIEQSDLQEILDGVVKVSFGNDGVLACNPAVSQEDVMQVLTLAL